LNHELLEFIIKHGADVNSVNHQGSRPLHAAAWSGKTESARVLLKYGADVNVRMTIGGRHSPLRFAVSWQHKEIVGLLIDAGAEYEWVSEEIISMRAAIVEKLSAWTNKQNKPCKIFKEKYDSQSSSDTRTTTKWDVCPFGGLGEVSDWRPTSQIDPNVFSSEFGHWAYSLDGWTSPMVEPTTYLMRGVIH